MLIDTTLPENLSCGNKAYLKSEGEIEQSSETAFELSDADTQQKSNVLENSDRLTACNEDGNILRESLVDTSSGPLDAEAANIGSFNGEKDVMDKGASPSPFSMASNDNDVVTERKGETREDDDPYGAKIWDEKDDSTRSFHVISDELHCNSEVAIFPSTCKETGTSIQNVDNILRTAECGFSVCGAEFDVISGLAMNLLPGDNENGDFDKSEAGTTVFSLEGDHETIDKQFEENSTAAIVRFSSCISRKINDVPASGCNEILKESDVADTIKEYIDSESSLSVDFEESHASLSINVSAQTDERNTHENDALREFEEDFDARLVNPEVEDGVQSVECLGTESKEQEEATCVDLLVKGSAADKPSVETKVEEQAEEMMFKEPNVGSKTVHSPASVDLVGNSVISEEEEFESEDGHISSSRPLCSTAKKNARTILIHGTPSKVLAMADMKENAPKNKSSNIGEFTTMRPPKRKALQDVQWK
ncbi:LOW QUALITY PROTEIN: hypothetical protein DH2020_047468 [Rehmannia glutinosa]|uniref:Uncharacterized protein n=1 Tax=Rehmannia glutinosa TaxID=99300 RepID=A0ABR0U8B2_REHGL